MSDAGGTPAVIPGPPAGTPPNITGFTVRIENKCNIPLYLHTEGGGGPLNPADPVLMPNAVITPTKNSWPTGWVQVFGEQGHTTLLDMVQVTVVRGTIWYKFDHANGIAIPIEVYASGAGPECGKRTGCYVPRAQIMSGLSRWSSGRAEVRRARRLLCRRGERSQTGLPRARRENRRLREESRSALRRPA